MTPFYLHNISFKNPGPTINDDRRQRRHPGSEGPAVTRAEDTNCPVPGCAVNEVLRVCRLWGLALSLSAPRQERPAGHGLPLTHGGLSAGRHLQRAEAGAGAARVHVEDGPKLPRSLPRKSKVALNCEGSRLPGRVPGGDVT